MAPYQHACTARGRPEGPWATTDLPAPLAGARRLLASLGQYLDCLVWAVSLEERKAMATEERRKNGIMAHRLDALKARQDIGHD